MAQREPVEVRFDLSALDRLAGATEDAVERVVRDATLYGEALAKVYAPKDTGRGAGRILSNIDGDRGEVRTNALYIAILEGDPRFGPPPYGWARRPGARPPPPDSLRGWLRRHGDFTTPFVLARSIGRKGIRGRGFFLQSARDVRKRLPQIIDRALDALDSERRSA